MVKKVSLFDVMLNELVRLSQPKRISLAGESAIDSLSLLRVRDIEQIFEKSELTQTELERARIALQNAYITVEPGYVVGRMHLLTLDLNTLQITLPRKGMRQSEHSSTKLKDFDSGIGPKTDRELHKHPKPLKQNEKMIFGDSEADKNLEEVAQKIRVRRANARENA